MCYCGHSGIIPYDDVLGFELSDLGYVLPSERFAHFGGAHFVSLSRLRVVLALLVLVVQYVAVLRVLSQVVAFQLLGSQFLGFLAFVAASFVDRQYAAVTPEFDIAFAAAPSMALALTARVSIARHCDPCESAFVP